MPDQLPNTIAGLLSPQAYPHAADDLELIQTHISYILLAGDYAYKIKKPVDFGFVDYSTLERRRAMCEAEVRLNRRLCDGVYLGVVPVTREGDAPARIEGSGATIEYAVKMRRVPREAMMTALLEDGALTVDHLRALAASIARFHAAGSPDPEVARFGLPDAIRESWSDNFDQAARIIADGDVRARIDALRRHLGAFLHEQEALFLARAADGRVRDGHGDLRADAVVFGDGGSICVMDCVEFSDRLRCCDVASDTAFLAMDLEERGFRHAADEFVSAYMEHVADDTLTVVLNFYRAYRATVRAKVEALTSAEEEVGAIRRREARRGAARYIALALRFTEPRSAALVIMCGLSGSGKSWVASALAARLGAALLRTDRLRGAAVAAEAAERHAAFGEGRYSPAEREHVYDVMLGRAIDYLDQGYGVVLDATFWTRGLRERARDVAIAHGLPFLAVHVTADPATIRARLAARDTAGSASDAGWDTYLAQRDSFEPLDELPRAEKMRVDSARPVGTLVERVVRRLERRR